MSRSNGFLAMLRFSLRSGKTSPLIWGASLGVFCGLIAAVWPSIEDSIGEAMKSYPESLKKTFNIQALDSVEQYVDVEMLSLIVPLAVAYYAIRLISRDTVQSEENGYLDSLLALPLRRTTLAWAAFSMALIFPALALGIMWILSLTGGWLAGVDIRPAVLLGGFANVWPLSTFFAGLALVLAGWLHRSAQVLGISAALLVGMYVLDLLGKLAPSLGWMKTVSVFHYYGSVIQNGANWSYSLGLVGVGLVLAMIGSWGFQRKDLL